MNESYVVSLVFIFSKPRHVILVLSLRLVMISLKFDMEFCSLSFLRISEAIICLIMFSLCLSLLVTPSFTLAQQLKHVGALYSLNQFKNIELLVLVTG